MKTLYRIPHGDERIDIENPTRAVVELFRPGTEISATVWPTVPDTLRSLGYERRGDVFRRSPRHIGEGR